jgi:hypothetical protein
MANTEMIYMARIATEEGLHWFNIGICENEVVAMKKARWKAVHELHGVVSQAKMVLPKVEWIDRYKRMNVNSRWSLVEVRV